MKSSIKDFDNWYQDKNLGNKIVVAGASASGKSTFSRKL
jgi:ABC-type polar amino acid transport system ATPase subunit